MSKLIYTDYHCSNCKAVYAKLDGLRFHQKNPLSHRPPCSDSNHEHQMIQEVFQSMEQAFQWVQDRELDRMFIIKTNKKNRTYFVYNCRHKERGNRNKNQSTAEQASLPITRKKRTVPYYPCTAKFIINKRDSCQCSESERQEGVICRNRHQVVQVYGCMTHCHELEGVNQRISQVSKNYIIALLQAGVPKSQVMERFSRDNVTENMEHQLITMAHLRNWENAYVKKRGGPTSSKLSQEMNDKTAKRKRALALVAEWQTQLASDEPYENVSSIIEHVELFNKSMSNFTGNALPEAKPNCPNTPVECQLKSNPRKRKFKGNKKEETTDSEDSS